MTVLPSYRFPRLALLRLVGSVVAGRTRSFQCEAQRLAAGIDRLRVEGEVPLLQPGARGWLITPNHYYRPGFGMWWMAIAISSCFPLEIHWVMSSQWRDLRPVRRWTVTPASAYIFPRLARAYNFTCMPAMPPLPGDTRERALAVRRLVQFARTAAYPVIGIAPEGMDTTTGGLMLPHSGVGRLLLHLSNLGLPLLPVGVFEEDHCLVVRFGLPYRLEMNGAAASEIIDRQVGDQVIGAIAALLPEAMRSIVPAHW
jgi:hypothetical protein